MKSITIHGLESRLVEGIERKAKERGASLNKTIKELIAQSLGMRCGGSEGADASTTSYRRFLAQWSEEEELAFNRASIDFMGTEAEGPKT